MKTKEQIKTISGKILFELEKENNTIKDTLIAGIRSGADLCDADLRCANLCNANLRCANLCNADLRCANLCDANLLGVNLYGANLRCANLCNADLRCANLYGANLYDADLRCANLYGANLRSADLRGADLRGATKVPFVPFACPSEGSFIGWKKIYSYLIKLEIPEDAKRCSATTNKCRCDRAKVLSITNIKSGEEIRELCNNSYSACVYKVGEMVYPDSYDNNRWNECSNGIHFFINKQEAINY